MNNQYSIKTNSKGRNILIVKGILPIDEISDIKGEDFDAIFVEDSNQSHFELSYQLQQMSPFHSLKCHLKPRILASSLSNRVLNLNILIDGFSTTINDENMNVRIEEIYNSLDMIETFDISEVKNNNYMYFLKLCKYAISRKMFTFTDSIEEAYAMGHTALYVAKKNNIPIKMNDDFIRFNHVLLELGYAKQKSFVERLHVCPHCKSSHLFYMESCPKCDSSFLKEEPVLHHFRCANISPESSYAYDGELRCPKCHHFLRHIGVDYDRPSNVYTCKECNHTFLHTEMKVYCSSCKKTHRPSALQENDVYSYEYTSEGLLALSSNEAVIAISKDIWAGYSKFESFLSQIRLFSYSHEKSESIFVNKFKIEGNDITPQRIMQIVDDFQKRFYYNNLSFKGNYIFMATKCPSELSEGLKHQIEGEHEEMLKIIELRHPGIIITEQDFLQQQAEEKIQTFIERINKTN